MKKHLSLIAITMALASCAVATLNPGAGQVQIVTAAAKIDGCHYLGEVIGSEGHWYTFLFIANRTLMQAALDDMRNQAATKGADTVLMTDPIPFNTSVTMLGIAYRCGGTKLAR